MHSMVIYLADSFIQDDVDKISFTLVSPPGQLDRPAPIDPSVCVKVDQNFENNV